MSETINYFYIENAYAGSNTVTVTRSGSYVSGQMIETLQYSKDLENWSSIDITSTTTTDLTLNEGEKVYFRNDNGKFSSSLATIRFNVSNSCISGGNIMSLLNYNDMLNTQLSQDCFKTMFYGCTSLTTAPELPATTLADSCYFSMFEGCTSLTTAPELPATTLADSCCREMFEGCTSLTTAPELPATTLADSCYQEMFRGCTSLTTAPELPATTLENNCYYRMFYGCTSLTTAPELPATTLENNCYSEMFMRCTSLTTAPELPATTLESYCYYRMFYECTLLNEVTIYANDIPAENCLFNWLEGVSATGTFHKNGFAIYSNNSSGIPSGWTVVTPFTYNNIIKFDYPTDSSELLNNIWVQTYTDTIQNTVIPQGEIHEETVERNWRTITFSFGSRPVHSGVFRIEVDDNGVPVQPYNYENISGDAIIDVVYVEGSSETDDSLTAYIDSRTHLTMSPFVSATPSTQYQGWIFTESTESETIITADYYTVTLYVNSLIDTFETTMFADDDNITSIEFDYDVTSIIDDAFNGCENLSIVTLTSTVPPTIGEDTFSLISPDAILYVPNASIPAYQNAGYGDYFADIRGLTPEPPTPFRGYGFNRTNMIDIDYLNEIGIRFNR